ncbi:MAG: MerR family DNA-binding transcriptional regulator [Acidobacteria bacterium]|nr:MerR family DNA-binding transcriptional regulator [Acidobacteriota bacterium]
MVMRHESELRIGELATRSGLTPDALRYYERLGLMPRASVSTRAVSSGGCGARCSPTDARRSRTRRLRIRTIFPTGTSAPRSTV